MSYRPKTERPNIGRASRGIAAAVALGVLLAGCSDIYFDRRETIALGADDAVAANMAEQMVDPWPPHSGNNNLPFSGERMQRAVECYRADKVSPPVDLNPSTPEPAAPAASTSNCQGKIASGSMQPAIGAPDASSIR